MNTDSPLVRDWSPNEFLRFLVELLSFARKHYPKRVLCSPFRTHVVLAQRAKNSHHVDLGGKPARGHGTVTMMIEDEAILDLKKPDDEGDLWVLVRVRRSVLDRFDSPVKLVHER